MNDGFEAWVNDNVVELEHLFLSTVDDEFNQYCIESWENFKESVDELNKRDGAKPLFIVNSERSEPSVGALQ